MIGYDDSAFMSCTDPPLTTVRQPIEAIGRAAVEMLAGQIEGSPVSADELFFEPEVVARGSTANALGALKIWNACVRQYEKCKIKSDSCIRLSVVSFSPP